MTTLVQQEVRMYWQIARDLAEAKKRGDPIDDNLDEVESILQYTENEALRARCRTLLDANRRTSMKASGT